MPLPPPSPLQIAHGRFGFVSGGKYPLDEPSQGWIRRSLLRRLDQRTLLGQRRKARGSDWKTQILPIKKMRIDCNACGNELTVTKVSWPDYIDTDPCDHCLRLAKEELLDDIMEGRITADEG